MSRTLESCDANVPLYALVEHAPEHVKAKAYIEAHRSDEFFVLSELVLVELYVLLRNPAVVSPALPARQAVGIIEGLRSNAKWMIADGAGGIMNPVWRSAKKDDFPGRAIFDLRLALSLQHYGVRRFATRNRKHFDGCGFDEVFDPVE